MNRPLVALLLGAAFATAPALADSNEELHKAKNALSAAKSISKQQAALATLGELPGSESEEVLRAQIERYRAGALPRALWLDLFEAAAKHPEPRIKKFLADLEAEQNRPGEPLRPWLECLEGGDPVAGQAIFRKKVEVNCVRCHKYQNEGGSIGPDLTGVGGTLERFYILESIVEPNMTISPGFEHVLLTLKDGSTVSGILNLESTSALTLTSVTDGHRQVVPTEEIAERTQLPSAMPPALAQVLGKRALRDLIEFLARTD